MGKKYGKILIVDDNEDILQAGRLFLKQHMAVVHTEKNPEMIPELLKHENYDVILLDMNFTQDVTSGKEGFKWLDKILEIDPWAVVVIITAYGDVEMAVRAIKAGATDFILKPWQNEKLLATISAAMKLRHSRTELDNLRSLQKQLSADMDQPFHNFIGQSPAMQEVFKTIRKVAKTDANVLILGENGTGKELVARALHRESKRSSKVFISVDMGAISESLFESELFGYVKGAFTDAKTNRAGRFEVASGGTLFLDEIGNLPKTLQSKILTVLENREIVRLGSHKPVPLDIRLICATNKSISDMVNKQEFRQDLLYRINTVEIHLPPLRNRKEDVSLLTDHFLKIYCEKYDLPLKKINSETIRKMEEYKWPGNVRELQHAMERAVIMCENNTLKPSDILFSHSSKNDDEVRLENLKLEEVEKLAVQKAIKKHKGNISRAARELGLTRTSLYRRLEKYGL